MTVMTFNGVASSGASYDVRSITKIVRPLFPGTEDRLMTVPGYDGVIDLGGDRKPLYISVEVRLNSVSAAARRTAARAWGLLLNVDEVKVLTFDDDSSYQYYARPVDTISIDEVALTGVFTINFIVPDSYTWASGLASGAAGAAIPRTFAVGGNVATPCKVTITLTGDVTPSEELRIINSTSGKSLTLKKDATRWNVDLVDGDVIIFDSGAELASKGVTVNGINANAGITIDSEFFQLSPGVNNTLNLQILTPLAYDNGTENVTFSSVNPRGTGTATKEATHLKLTTSGANYSVWTFQTDDFIDLTFVDEIDVEWERINTVGTGFARLHISDSAGARVALMNCTAIGAPAVETLNVAALKGNHKIEFNRTTSSGDAGELKVYEVDLKIPMFEIPGGFTDATISVIWRARFA